MAGGVYDDTVNTLDRTTYTHTQARERAQAKEKRIHFTGVCMSWCWVSSSYFACWSSVISELVDRKLLDPAARYQIMSANCGTSLIGGSLKEGIVSGPGTKWRLLVPQTRLVNIDTPSCLPI